MMSKNIKIFEITTSASKNVAKTWFLFSSFFWGKFNLAAAPHSNYLFNETKSRKCAFHTARPAAHCSKLLEELLNCSEDAKNRFLTKFYIDMMIQFFSQLFFSSKKSFWKKSNICFQIFHWKKSKLSYES